MNNLKHLFRRGLIVPIVAAAAVGGGGLLATASASAAAAAPSSAPPGGSRVVGHVYVNDDTAPTNTVAGFARHADGALTALPGSPFPAGGAGTGSGLASQGAVQLADGGRLLLAVDAGSNQVSVLRVHRNGSLTPVADSPTASGGAQPVSIAVNGNLVYVANAGSTDTDYSGFELSGRGRLNPLAGSTVPLPSDAQPGDVLFNSTGTKLVGTLVGSSQIDSYVVDPDGLLIDAPGSPYPAQGVGPFGSAFSPTSPNQLFVSNAHNTGQATISSFLDASDGALSSIGTSPVANGQIASCWVVANPDGHSIYSINTGSGTITSYAVAGDGSLTVADSTPIRTGTGAGNSVDAGITPDGRFIYVDESKTDAVAEFIVHGTQLSEVASSPVALPTGATAAGIAVQ